MSAALSPGFKDAAHDAQRVFRVLMDALARPTTVQPLALDLAPPAPLTPELASIALALADGDAPLWLDETLAAEPAVAQWLRFHTGAAVVTDPADAAFALVRDPRKVPPLDAFALGTEEFPDRSTTIVLVVDSLEGGTRLRVEGPGLPGPGTLSPTPLPDGFTETLRDNRALFPRGVDFLFAAPGALAALPRSSRLLEEA